MERHSPGPKTYLVKLQFRNNDEVKTFQNKQIETIYHLSPALQVMLKDMPILHRTENDSHNYETI